MFRNKFRKKEVNPKMATLEKAKKAYADLSEDDKKLFLESLKDRVDETESEQPQPDANEDSQVAEDSGDETLTEGENTAEEDATNVETESEVKEETQEDAESKTEGDKEPTIGEVMELVTKLTAEVAALRHAQETDKPVEEVGVDGEFVDEIAPAMPASYLEEAKKMRY